MKLNIEILQEDATGFESTTELLEHKLLQSLRSELVQSDNQSFALIAKTLDGEIVAGLSASSSYNWLLIKVLWVREANRGVGIGKQLLQRAEQRASELGCHAVWLDTSNPLAERFYTRLGYSEFGRLDNQQNQFPPTHQRWFLRKYL